MWEYKTIRWILIVCLIIVVIVGVGGYFLIQTTITGAAQEIQLTPIVIDDPTKVLSAAQLLQVEPDFVLPVECNLVFKERIASQPLGHVDNLTGTMLHPSNISGSLIGSLAFLDSRLSADAYLALVNNVNPLLSNPVLESDYHSIDLDEGGNQYIDTGSAPLAWDSIETDFTLSHTLFFWEYVDYTVRYLSRDWVIRVYMSNSGKFQSGDKLLQRSNSFHWLELTDTGVNWVDSESNDRPTVVAQIPSLLLGVTEGNSVPLLIPLSSNLEVSDLQLSQGLTAEFNLDAINLVYLSMSTNLLVIQEQHMLLFFTLVHVNRWDRQSVNTYQPPMDPANVLTLNNPFYSPIVTGGDTLPINNCNTVNATYDRDPTAWNPPNNNVSTMGPIVRYQWPVGLPCSEDKRVTLSANGSTWATIDPNESRDIPGGFTGTLAIAPIFFRSLTE